MAEKNAELVPQTVFQLFCNDEPGTTLSPKMFCQIFVDDFQYTMLLYI
jgi:hypothetical protein